MAGHVSPVGMFLEKNIYICAFWPTNINWVAKTLVKRKIHRNNISIHFPGLLQPTFEEVGQESKGRGRGRSHCWSILGETSIVFKFCTIWRFQQVSSHTIGPNIDLWSNGGCVFPCFLSLIIITKDGRGYDISATCSSLKPCNKSMKSDGIL